MPRHIGLLLSSLSLSFSAGSQTVSAAKGDGGFSVWGGAWLSLVSLTLLVLLLALIWWFYKTYGQRRMAGPVQVLASQALGPRERILIVRIEDRILALGQTAHHIQLLTELDSFTEVDPSVSQGSPAFSAVLGKFWDRSSR